MFVPRRLNNKRFALGQYAYSKSNKIRSRHVIIYIQFDCCYELEPDRRNENPLQGKRIVFECPFLTILPREHDFPIEHSFLLLSIRFIRPKTWIQSVVASEYDDAVGNRGTRPDVQPSSREIRVDSNLLFHARLKFHALRRIEKSNRLA